MAERHREYKPTKRLTTQEKLEPILNWIYEAKASNASDKTVAIRLGWDVAKFHEQMEAYVLHGEKPLKLAYEAGMATFEWENIQKLDDLIESDELSPAAKAKLLLERLKRLEQWAPATKAVRVQVEDSRTILEFESHHEADTQGPDQPIEHNVKHRLPRKNHLILRPAPLDLSFPQLLGIIKHIISAVEPVLFRFLYV